MRFGGTLKGWRWRFDPSLATIFTHSGWPWRQAEYIQNPDCNLIELRDFPLLWSLKINK